MKEKTIASQSVMLPLKSRPLPCWLAFMCIAATAFAQQPKPTDPPKPPPYTEGEKTFAAQIVALPLDAALHTIAAADASLITLGLYTAIHDTSNQVFAQDPHRSIAMDEEAEAVATRAGLPIQAADAHTNRASGMASDGQTFDAVTVYDEAQAMYKVVGAPPKKIAYLCLSRASARLHLGDLTAAIADANEALRINREIGDEINEARAQNTLGNIFVAEADFGAAQSAFNEALRIARAHGEKLGEAYVLNNLATAYASEGDYATAVSYSEASLKIKRAIGSKQDIASTLVNLANEYHVLGRNPEANRALTEAADIGRETQRKIITAKAVSEMGIIQLETHHPQAALPLLEEGYRIGQDVEDLNGQVIDLNKIAKAHYELHEYELARKYSAQGAELARGAGMADVLATATLYEAQSDVALGKLDDARRAYQESIGAIEQMRGTVTGGAAEREKFLAERVDPYRFLAALDAKQGDWAAALDNSEKAKGRILLDAYAGDPMNATGSLTDAERNEEIRLQSRVLSPHSNTNAADLKTAQADLANFRGQIYVQHPELRLRRAEFAAITPGDLQALVPDRSTALLEYELTSRGSFMFVITRGAHDTAAIHGYKLAVSATELAKHVRHYHDQLASRDPDFATESRWLYTSLLQPAQLLLKAKTSLVIVPDGVLWHVPFQSLQQADGTYLAENSAITYIPSLAVLHALKNSAVKRHPGRTLLAMGDPGGETPEEASETNALQALYGAGNSKAFLGKAATLGQFRLSSASYDVVHIAAHGIFDDHDPMSSHMVMASTGPRPRDSWLQARELQNMKLHAELVVLSGCETGEGAFEDGEGLVGMSWAALAAGAHGTVASAWRVEALSTTEMMLSFHHDLLHGVAKSEALRKAELKLIHSEKYSHPFYWAAFDLMGDGA
jgi:CHAT domain-containing protein